jgi:hypothetical protein
MKSFNEYIVYEENINESLILNCLAGAFVAWGIKSFFKTAESIKDSSETLQFIWKTVFENNNDNEQPLLEEEEPKKKIKLTKDKIKAIQIPDEKILKQAIEATKPSLSKDGKSGTGLYTIAGKIKDNADFGKIDKKPYYINYAAFVTEDRQICGMFGFSIKFWHAMLKKDDADKKVKELAKKYQKALHIFDMQICPEFEEDVVYEVVWDTFEKIIKELKISTITIHYDSKEELDIYKKHGFEEIEGTKEYLVLTKNKK